MAEPGTDLFSGGKTPTDIMGAGLFAPSAGARATPVNLTEIFHALTLNAFKDPAQGLGYQKAEEAAPAEGSPEAEKANAEKVKEAEAKAKEQTGQTLQAQPNPQPQPEQQKQVSYTEAFASVAAVGRQQDLDKPALDREPPAPGTRPLALEQTPLGPVVLAAAPIIVPDKAAEEYAQREEEERRRDGNIFEANPTPSQRAQLAADGPLAGSTEGFNGAGKEQERLRREEEKKNEQAARFISQIMLERIALAQDVLYEANEFTGKTLARIESELQDRRASLQTLDTRIAETDQQIFVAQDEVAGLEGQQVQAAQAVVEAEQGLAVAAQNLGEAKDEKTTANVMVGLESSSMTKLADGRLIFASYDESGKKTYVNENVQAYTDEKDLAEITEIRRQMIERQKAAVASGELVMLNPDILNSDTYEPITDIEDYKNTLQVDQETDAKLATATDEYDRAKSTLDYTQTRLSRIDEQLKAAREKLGALQDQKSAMTEERKALLQQISNLETQQQQAKDYQKYLNDPDTRAAIDRGEISATQLVDQMPEFMRADFLKQNPELAKRIEIERQELAQEAKNEGPAATARTPSYALNGTFSAAASGIAPDAQAPAPSPAQNAPQKTHAMAAM